VEWKWEPDDMSEILIDSVATYIDAIEKFGKFAQAFREHMNLLNQARNEYQKATTAGVELRTALDAGDEVLRTLMAQLENAVSVPLVEMAPGSKDVEQAPEPLRTDRFVASGATAAVVRTFP
jgi:hypothetical protein